MINEETELDAWVDWNSSNDDEIVVCVHRRGIGLAYPFSIETFWKALEEVDDEAVAGLDIDL